MQQQNKEVNELVITRLKQERKQWRQDHPHRFVAKPMTKEDGTINMLKWYCEIPGPEGSPWEGGVYILYMDFSQSYPIKPPKCQFKPVLPHPNVYPSGTVCLSILNEEEDWKSAITIKQILMGIQKLLKDEPNIDSPAQYEPCALYRSDKEKYYKKVREFAETMKKKD
ncbi:ubiquitin-conjugating enzyme (macronuclear) [Tetrahymena thermophila SB210]|uniref:SUMO-conjugating enzyme UBC9 n=1 Tax=Tetrahymena thermophila (strain SB210) TaxID=312017 RepID=I7MIS2_TETTS|nr:ubiquitin-conjugating enzyme [Tetrahymena thermophila SB210]EAR94205.2 ubiquitin-conjugating enzyme [Tetrahymena thermophila SB210]|eukprot:XP_001014450.2 ubiquitin-conjugating enzyme [Tetrahymena thermophila SB210]